MNIIVSVLIAITSVLVLYAAFPLLSILASILIPTNKKRKQLAPDADFACIITAYGDADIAVEQVHSLLAQSYKKFHVYVVADNWKTKVDFPASDKLTILYPDIFLHSKLKSIQLAINSFVRPHTFICILDADNLLHSAALENLNIFVHAGFKAIQGQRTAKNLDTKVAALDALSEIYYNTSQRLAAFKIGSSATIAGSGMAIEANFFRNYVNTLLDGSDKIILAEDKLLQMMLVENGERIAYCRNALIFDEKVSEGAQVQRQRTRWLGSWFDHWGQAVKLALKGILKLNWNQFYFGVMLSFPPMILLVAGLLFMLLAGLLISTQIVIIAAGGLILFSAGFVIALVVAPAPATVWKAIPAIPYFATRQILAMLKIKTDSKNFNATTHTQYLGIHQVWEQRKNDFPYLKN
jgi:cellulose synthase/poly-beta-1,6-N-acetylglucosamine synthase-like glycosyltransferase